MPNYENIIDIKTNISMKKVNWGIYSDLTIETSTNERKISIRARNTHFIWEWYEKNNKPQGDQLIAKLKSYFNSKICEINKRLEFLTEEVE
jgi:hypothetical protein